jgi:hypothetical protein
MSTRECSSAPKDIEQATARYIAGTVFDLLPSMAPVLSGQSTKQLISWQQRKRWAVSIRDCPEVEGIDVCNRIGVEAL